MIKVFHASYQIIEKPDVHYGRINADFGQGFYVTDSKEFASRWVRQKPGENIYINCYELDDETLNIKKLDRDSEWFKYVFSNRRSLPDSLSEYDVITGPIANDTIFNTLGIMTSGVLTDEQAMSLLSIGPCYKQIALKTNIAASKLKFISSEILSLEEIQKNRALLEADEEKYLEEFAAVMNEIL